MKAKVLICNLLMGLSDWQHPADGTQQALLEKELFHPRLGFTGFYVIYFPALILVATIVCCSNE